MLVEKKKERPSGEIGAGSMADISFLLLIFFLLTTTFDTDKGIPMVLPERGGEAKINPKYIAKVIVNDAGGILFDDEIVDLSQLEEQLVERMEEAGYEDGKSKLIVSIKTDRQTDYNQYIQVLDTVKEAGVSKISIAEPESD